MDKHMIRGGNGSHWEGCEETHWDCKIAKLEAKIADLTRTNAQLDCTIARMEWIPVEERLPEYGKAVFILTTGSVVPKIGRHSPAIPQWTTTDLMYYHDISYSMVTHWRPIDLPDADKESEEC